MPNDRQPKKRAGAKPGKNSGNSLLWVVLAGGAVLFCVLPIVGAGIVGAVYWLKPAPTDPGAGLKADDKKQDPAKPNNEKPGVIADRVRFSADFAQAGDAPRIFRVFLSRHGKRVAITNGGLSSRTQVWDISGEPKKLQDFAGTCEAISPDGKRVIVNKEKDRFILDADTGADKAPIGRSGNPYFHDDNQIWTFRGPYEGRALLTKINPINGQRQDKDIAIPVKGSGIENVYHLSDKGELFCYFKETAEHHVWDTNTQKWTRKTSLKLGAGERIPQGSHTTYSPDGQWLVAQAGTAPPFGLTVFNTSTGAGTKLPRDEFSVVQPVFVAGKDLLLLRNYQGPNPNKVIVAYDVKANAIVGSFGNVESISIVAVSSDGGTLAAGTGEGQVVIWDVKKLK
jgi:WD40 repeat protein